MEGRLLHFCRLQPCTMGRARYSTIQCFPSESRYRESFEATTSEQRHSLHDEGSSDGLGNPGGRSRPKSSSCLRPLRKRSDLLDSFKVRDSAQKSCRICRLCSRPWPAVIRPITREFAEDSAGGRRGSSVPLGCAEPTSAIEQWERARHKLKSARRMWRCLRHSLVQRSPDGHLNWRLNSQNDDRRGELAIQSA